MGWVEVIALGLKFLYLLLTEALKMKSEAKESDQQYANKKAAEEALLARVHARMLAKAPAEHHDAVDVEDQLDGDNRRDSAGPV